MPTIGPRKLSIKKVAETATVLMPIAMTTTAKRTRMIEALPMPQFYPTGGPFSRRNFKRRMVHDNVVANRIADGMAHASRQSHVSQSWRSNFVNSRSNCPRRLAWVELSHSAFILVSELINGRTQRGSNRHGNKARANQQRRQ